MNCEECIEFNGSDECEVGHMLYHNGKHYEPKDYNELEPDCHNGPADHCDDFIEARITMKCDYCMRFVEKTKKCESGHRIYNSSTFFFNENYFDSRFENECPNYRDVSGVDLTDWCGKTCNYCVSYDNDRGCMENHETKTDSNGTAVPEKVYNGRQRYFCEDYDAVEDNKKI